jgi:ATP-dependent DNA ligase
VVIGFTESTHDRQGMLHDLLLGVVRSDGSAQVLCRVGGGFTDENRREMLSDLQDMVVDSEYAEVNSDHVAYQMVKPKWVVEISCLDLISQNTRGGPVNRMVLNWNSKDERYEVVRRLPLVSVISPQFIRVRDDK